MAFRLSRTFRPLQYHSIWHRPLMARSLYTTRSSASSASSASSTSSANEGRKQEKSNRDIEAELASILGEHKQAFQPESPTKSTSKVNHVKSTAPTASTSVTPPDVEPAILGNQEKKETQQRPEQTIMTPSLSSMDIYREYLERAQSELKHRLDPLYYKVQSASKKLKELTHNVHDSREALQRASRALNELTGYNQIEAIKTKVNDQAKLFEQTRDRVQEAKQQYEHAIETRSDTQRGINELLQRKHLWTGDDVTRFTELYRLEHEHSRNEATARERYQQCEKDMDREYMELARSIMERYHEEQLWSDKIRSVSTYGTWALMVVNLLLFVAVQTVFEPHKRKRLTQRFEELLVTKIQEEEVKFNEALAMQDQKDQKLAEQQELVLATLGSLVAQSNDDGGVQLKETFDALRTKDEQLVEQQKAVLATLTELASRPWAGGDLSAQEPYPVDEPTVLDTSMPYVVEEQLPSAAPTAFSTGISKKTAILYSLESALTGGLITALAIFYFK